MLPKRCFFGLYSQPLSMNKKKIVTIIGARPQFIKAAPLSKAIAAHPDLEEVIIHTGQHFDENMSAVFFNEMGIPEPRYKLAINSLNHGAMTGRMLEEIEKILMQEQPYCVLVYGDTNSTLAGALAAKKHHIKVAQVEAGLRSFNMKMPEEVNRILTDRISDWLFCPSDAAIQNLQQEAYDSLPCKVVRTGDIMCDALMFFTPYAPSKSKIVDLCSYENYALCTIHRAENTDDAERLKNIVEALNVIHQTLPVVVPLHPRTQKIMAGLGLEIHFKTLPPVGYLDMLGLLENCKIVLCDSGGLQKEAYLKEKYCITLRDETEWIELVNLGVNKLVGADKNDIINTFLFLQNQPFNAAPGLYGDGSAAFHIANELAE